jgi:hypothetical protein
MTAAPAPGSSPEAAPRGGPPAWFAVLAIGGLLVGIVMIAAQVIGIGVIRPAPAPTMAPAGEAAQRTWDQVAATLGQASFQVVEPVTAYRPGESPALVDVPRRLLQVVLPSEPAGGYVVVYELPDEEAAGRVGRDFAGYLASGTGAIQYPRDAQFVLQRLGRTLVFFAWSPQANPDPRLAELGAALRTVGQPVTP